MLFKLPIIIENKVVHTLFKLIKNNTYYTLSLFNNINNDEINCDVLSDKTCTTTSDGNMVKIMITQNI